MNILTDLLLIQFITVNLIDLSGFIQEAEGILGKWLHIRAHIPKPFSCSYCMTWWIGLTYLILTSNCTLPYVSILLGLCFLTTTTGDVMHLIKDFLTKIVDIFYKLIQN